MKKQFLALSMAAMLLAGLLSGCTKPSGTAGAPLKIGGIGPTTGGAAVYGIAARNGAQIAVEEINALGGLQIEFNWQDDAHDTEKSVNAYNALQDWGMQVLCGTVTTDPCLAVGPEAFADRVFTLTPSASSPKVVEGKDNIFQMCFSDLNQGIASAQYIAGNNLATKVAVIYNNADPYSTGVYEKFASEAAGLGLDVVSIATFTNDTATDFSVQLTSAKNAGADLIFLPIYCEPASLILAQAKGMGYAPKFFGVDGMDGILTLKGFDPKLAEGVMLLTPFAADATDARTVSFVKKYQEKFSEIPNQFAADGYDCIYALYQAAQDAGVDGSTSAKDACEKMIAAFTASDFKVDGLTGAGMTWATTGEVSKAPMAIIIQDGVYVGM